MTKIREYNPRVGDTWLTRSGDHFAIISVSTAGEHPVLAIDNKKRMAKFTREGYFVSEQFPNPNDLVERM